MIYNQRIKTKNVIYIYFFGIDKKVLLVIYICININIFYYINKMNIEK